jgi:hypothetical protein
VGVVVEVQELRLQLLQLLRVGLVVVVALTRWTSFWQLM